MKSSGFRLEGLPSRSEKPRDVGLTHVLDKGLSTREVEDILDVAAQYIDLVKFGWGTAAVSPHLEEKISIYSSADIPVYLGGTLFEAYCLREKVDTYCRLLDQLGITHLEVSNGVLDIDHEDKTDWIRQLSGHYVVLSEVGSKDRDTIMPPYKWTDQIQKELDSGSWKVICEARESGRAGVFRPNGEIRTGLIDEILSEVDAGDLIFEAPRKSQQVWFLKELDSNVNLGNITPSAVLSLETLRLGLRGDTLLDFGPRRDGQ